MADQNPPGPPLTGVQTFLKSLREHRLYRVALGYAVGAWIVLQVAAIVLPGFAAPPWALRAVMVLLALGFGAALLSGWGYDRHRAGLPLLPRAPKGRLAWALTAVLPAVAVAAYFLTHPLPRPAAGGGVSEKSLAVLPFDNFSEDKDSAMFADGVQDEVLTDLAQIADLKVISRSSVMQYKDARQRNLREIGRALGVAHVVEGSVQRAGGRIRVTAQLIDARTDAHRWAERYERDLQDVFAIQSEIAQAIAGQLQAAISPQEHAAIAEAPTHDLEAYSLYLQAVQMLNDRDAADLRGFYERVIYLLTAATDRDPRFVRAFAYQTYLQALIYDDFETTPAQDAVVRGLAETVARLRPGSGEARMATGLYDSRVREDYPSAWREYTAAARLLPNDAKALLALAVADQHQGLWEDALVHLRKAAALDPRDTEVAYRTIVLLARRRRYAEAQALLDHAIASQPRVSWAHQTKAALLLAWQGDPAPARAELALLAPDFDPYGAVTELRLRCDWFARDFDAAGRDLAAGPAGDVDHVPREFWQGCTARYRGDGAGAAAAFGAARDILAARALARPADPKPLILLALADAGLGRKPDALAEGRRAVSLRPPEKDALEGPPLALKLACVLAWTGERDEAIATLQALCAKPRGPDYGDLKAHPDWDALRGDPRFEALVASLAPKR